MNLSFSELWWVYLSYYTKSNGIHFLKVHINLNYILEFSINFDFHFLTLKLKYEGSITMNSTKLRDQRQKNKIQDEYKS